MLSQWARGRPGDVPKGRGDVLKGRPWDVQNGVKVVPVPLGRHGRPKGTSRGRCKDLIFMKRRPWDVPETSLRRPRDVPRSSLLRPWEVF